MLRIAMIGMIPGNGHPYSWSSIINGYDPNAMEQCPYPAIPAYLRPHPNLPMPSARVTHLWTDDPGCAASVASTARIEKIVERPEDVIGEVDGVILATDDGDDHVRRARPFVEAGLPVFVDKPLATNTSDLQQFSEWIEAGARIQSSSGLRYAPELDDIRGKWRWITALTPQSWKRYGIHLLEPAMVLLGPGFKSVSLTHSPGSSVAYVTHESGTVLTLAAMEGVTGGMFRFHAHGISEYQSVALADFYTAFRRQLEAVLAWMRGGEEPVPFKETRELMLVLLAGIRSGEQGGRSIPVYGD